MRRVQTSDGSIVDVDTGKVLYFSRQRFVKDICQGLCCFICGADPGSKPFNDEHILPRWILSRFNLFEKQITLPNDKPFKYGSYTIPCCRECNSMMGEVFEQPMQRLFALGGEAVTDYIQKNGILIPFAWMSLIFLKSHLKDNLLTYHLDHRKGTKKIGDLYEWDGLHHIHCIARSFYVGATIEPEAFGTFFVFPAKSQGGSAGFDFVDLYQPRAMLLRIDDLVLYTVLNDSCAALNRFMPFAQLISGALSEIQVREVLGHLAYINLSLAVRPRFFTTVADDGSVVISAERIKELRFDPYVPEHLGAMIYRCCRDILEQSQQPNLQEVISDLKAGKKAFLFEGDSFIENSFTILPADRPS